MFLPIKVTLAPPVEPAFHRANLNDDTMSNVHDALRDDCTENNVLLAAIVEHVPAETRPDTALSDTHRDDADPVWPSRTPKLRPQIPKLRLTSVTDIEPVVATLETTAPLTDNAL